ncbi:integrase [Aphanothece hegewaldii CCALA 016]|uniref:Integrase n=1 Tax=Aphanothece hegewaldii CCALA 016 TaxID=2107694 RepID=A0A2T1LQP5_9CHRO|nr:tyrosine-type recombinase/integrase [Aphanothece hegewaldii]PSF29178.1 integrase [Aphanothece hegewaldii CCALA 016]
MLTPKGTQVLTNATNDDEIILSWLSGKAKTTKVSYYSTAKQFREFIGKPLSDVMIEDLNLWCDRLKMTYKPVTVQDKILIIKSLYSYCFSVGYLQNNIMALIKTPKVKDDLAQRILDEREVKLLINATSNHRDKVILALMYGCGLRVSEVSELTWGDLKNGKLTVYGKGNKTRTVIVPESVIMMLLNLKPHPKLPYMFTSRSQTRLSRVSIFKMVKKCAEMSGLSDKISPHFLRHSHASHSLKNGANVRLVQASLGHSSVTTTERYLHIDPDECSSQFINL